MSKKLLATALALCMLLCTVPPVVAASPNGGDYATVGGDEGQDGSPFGDGHVPLPERDGPHGQGYTPDSGFTRYGDYTGATITPSEDTGLDLKRDLSSQYLLGQDTPAPTDTVRVIVVFEEPALLDQGFTAQDLQDNGIAVINERAEISSYQDELLDRIEQAIEDAMAGIPLPASASSAVEVNYKYDTLFNGMSLDMPYGALEAVSNVEGVRSAFLAGRYELPDDLTDGEAEKLTFSTSKSVGAVQTWGVGYNGDGMRVAVIDTGLDVTHPSFSAEGFTPTDPLTEAEIAAAMPNLHAASKDYSTRVTAQQLHVNTKVPYAFCYVDSDTDVSHTDGQGDHGTHVAGIIAANKTEGTDVVGVAPGAQLLIMKVFGDNGGAYQDDIAAALEDCFYLGVDSVNMSLGSNAGFPTSVYEWENEIYNKVASHGMILAVAAGNSTSAAYGNPTGTNLNKTDDPDNSIISSPATYAGATAVASSENSSMMMVYFEVNGQKIVYIDVADTPFTTLVTDEEAGTTEYKYVVIPGVGKDTDFEQVQEAIDSLEEAPWIALVQRGEIDFTSKQTNAYNAGAAGCVVYDNVDGPYSGMVDAGLLPNVFITLADGTTMVEAAKNDNDGQEVVGTMVVNISGLTAIPNPDGGKMSEFSSWGLSTDLTLVPDITAPGGHIYSTLDGGEYGDMSGTSMATPQIAGMSALVIQYLQKTHPEIKDTELHNVAEALLMSTATPLIESETEGGVKVPYSPRRQGAGLANVYNAVTTPAYLTVKVDDNEELTPKASLKDNANGVYSFTFKITNMSGEPHTYTLDSTLVTDQYQTITGYDGEYMSETSRLLSTKAVFSGSGVADNKVTVEANGTAEVTVSITLTKDDKTYMDGHYKSGIYVDGFISLTPEENDKTAVALGLPLCGFYGDWSKAKVFDTGWWYEDEEASQYERYFHVVFTDNFLLGVNPYTDTPYNDHHNVLSMNGDGYGDAITDIYVSMMRSAKLLTFTWSEDKEGTKVLYRAEYPHAQKSYYVDAYGLCVPIQYSYLTMDGETEMYDFTKDSVPLENDTTVYLTVAAWLDDGDNTVDQSFVVPITIDNEKPQIIGTPTLTEDGKLKVTVSDNNCIAAVMPITSTGNAAEYITVEDTDHEADKQYEIEIDLAGLDSVFQLVVADYGFNETYYTVTLNTEPTFDANSWYAYRQFSWGETDYGTLESTDYYNGWWSFSGDDASDMVFRDSSAATGAADVSAADYVDGYIIGIEEPGTDDYTGEETPAAIFAIKPGSWTRLPVGTLTFEEDGETVAPTAVDMAFNYKDSKIYVLTARDESGTALLLTLDPASWTVTSHVELQGPENELLTLAASKDGTLYSVDTDDKDAKLYTIGTDGAVEAVGSTGVATGAIVYSYDWDLEENVASVQGFYQSMAFDHSAEGGEQLYWANYLAQSDPVTYETDVDAVFYKVDTAKGTATKVSDVLLYGELAGLFKPNTEPETEVIPEAEKVTGLTISSESIALIKGEEALLEIFPEPFNASTKDVVWSSSEESVAKVEAGVVTALKAGTTTITASVDGVSAKCAVTVIEPVGSLYFYDNMTYQWVKVRDVADTSTAEFVPGSISPTYAITAAAYHNGKVYAYDASGCFYVLDPKTMNGVKLGSCGEMINAMAFNYKDGFMYGIKEHTEGMMWEQVTTYTLVQINMNTGAIRDVAVLDYDTVGQPCYGMTIDNDGKFYLGTVNFDYDLELTEMTVTEDDDGFTIQVPEDGHHVMSFREGWTQYGSIHYSDANKAIFWANDLGQLYYIDTDTFTDVYLGGIMSLELAGEAFNMGLLEIVEDEPEVPEVKATDFSIADKYIVLQGGTAAVKADIEPWNATDELICTIDKTDVADVTDGVISGKTVGTAELTVTVGDLEAKTAAVQVLESGAVLHGIAIQDYTAQNYGFWIHFSDTDPGVEPAVDDDSLFVTEISVYAGAMYDGMVYAYLQGDESMDYEHYLTTFDTDNFEMGELVRCSYPIRDMAMDYTTGALYAVCSGGLYEGAVIQIDRETGEAYLIGDAGTPLAAATFDESGNLYAIGENGMLYSVNTSTAKLTEIGPTGYTNCTGYQSMHYDPNTKNTYWTYLDRESASGGLQVVDLATGTATDLGAVFTGLVIGALYTVPEKAITPEPTTEATKVVLSDKKATVNVGGSIQLTAAVLPLGESQVDDSIIWRSDNETVATVDANGTVTGFKAGTATIKATNEASGRTAECLVTVTDFARRFFAYDQTDGQWVSFDANGTMSVEHIDAQDEEELQVSYYVQSENKIYAYGVSGAFYAIDPDTYARTKLGEMDFGEYEDDHGDSYPIVPVDLGYDAESGKLYLTATAMEVSEWGYYGASAFIYEVDKSNGTATQLFESGEYALANLEVVNGKLYGIDTFQTGVITVIDPETGDYTQPTMVKTYWSEPTSSRSFFTDALTGQMYAVRDFAGGSMGGNGDTPEPILYAFDPNDASIVEVMSLGGAVLHGVHLREKTVPMEVPAIVGDPEVSSEDTVLDGVDDAKLKEMTDALANTKPDTSALTEIAGNTVDVPEDAVTDGIEALEAAGVTATEEDVRIVAESYLNIGVESYSISSEDKTLALEIDAFCHLLATTAAEDEEIIKDEANKNAVEISGSDQKLSVNSPITLWVGLPLDFVDDDVDSILVKHTKDGSEHYHMASISRFTDDKGEVIRLMAVFTSSDGLSPFVFSTSNKAVAQIGGTYYATLQEAVDAAKDGDTIIVSDPEAKAVVGRSLGVTLKGSEPEIDTSKMLSPAGGYSMNVEVGEDGSCFYTFYSSFVPTPTYSVNVGDMEHGSVTADKSSATYGSTVTLTVKPDEGYTIGTVTVTDQNGKAVEVTDNGDGTYSFRMPAGQVNVKVTAVFGCDGGESCPSSKYTDVDQHKWYHESVDYAVLKELMDGTAPTVFSPAGTATRGMVVTILYRLEGEPAVDGSTTFADVSAGAWYARAVAWAAANDIVTGYSDVKFGPSDPITRQQLAAILYRYAEKKGYVTSEPESLAGFVDAESVSSWAEDGMRWAVDAGLIQGVDDTHLAPGNKATRAQIATVLMRFCESIVK